MLDESALLVLRKRYLVKDETGHPMESPEGLFRRVAGFIAGAEDNFERGQAGRVEEEFYAMLSESSSFRTRRP